MQVNKQLIFKEPLWIIELFNHCVSWQPFPWTGESVFQWKIQTVTTWIISWLKQLAVKTKHWNMCVFGFSVRFLFSSCFILQCVLLVCWLLLMTSCDSLVSCFTHLLVWHQCLVVSLSVYSPWSCSCPSCSPCVSCSSCSSCSPCVSCSSCSSCSPSVSCFSCSPCVSCSPCFSWSASSVFVLSVVLPKLFFQVLSFFLHQLWLKLALPVGYIFVSVFCILAPLFQPDSSTSHCLHLFDCSEMRNAQPPDLSHSSARCLDWSLAQVSSVCGSVSRVAKSTGRFTACVVVAYDCERRLHTSCHSCYYGRHMFIAWKQIYSCSVLQ